MIGCDQETNLGNHLVGEVATSMVIIGRWGNKNAWVYYWEVGYQQVSEAVNQDIIEEDSPTRNNLGNEVLIVRRHYWGMRYQQIHSY